MSEELKPSRSNRIDLPLALARWAIGGWFIYMGLVKALHPVEFLKLVHQYQLTGDYILLNSIAAALPWFEVFCGTLLLLGLAVRGTALMLVLLLVPFTAVVLHRALGIAAAQHLQFVQVKFDCGCGAGEVFIWKKMIENGALILLSGALISGLGKKFSLKYSLFDSTRVRPSKESKAVPSAVSS